MSSSTMEHFCHPKHPLILKEENVIGEDAISHGCNRPVIGFPTFTCSSDDANCKNFYLHKSCAELPKQIHHHKHTRHPLVLIPPIYQYCYVCTLRVTRFTYTCEDCQYYVCVFCAFEQRVLVHEGHDENTLTLMKREALFKCDACGEEATDSCYVCSTCEVWIHKRCAFSPSIIPNPTYHHHPLKLIYSIPDLHRYFARVCDICDKVIERFHWLYYCHKCTYFVHINCATRVNEIEEDDHVDHEPDLLQFPLSSEESLLDFIMTQCGNLQTDFQCKDNNSITISTSQNEPQIIEEHWSHKNHPLEKLQFTPICEDDKGDNYDDRKVLICDGCIQPITAFHPYYYACIQCGFILHSFCATKLPQELRAGASPFHPQHSLLLRKTGRFYSLVTCKTCQNSTNGFYYYCESCDIKIDICCAFLPTKIKHKSHKYHSLVQCELYFTTCSVSKLRIPFATGYECETCSNFKISIACVLYPSRIKHRYDLHPITLRNPPFFYEGAIYCEICEEQVNNQGLLYHCDECDHSFHYSCPRQINIKSKETIKFSISSQPHTFALVHKRRSRNNPVYFCGSCRAAWYFSDYFMECDGCGFFVCLGCAIEIFG